MPFCTGEHHRGRFSLVQTNKNITNAPRRTVPNGAASKIYYPLLCEYRIFCDKYVRKREPARPLVRYIYRSEVNGINR